MVDDDEDVNLLHPRDTGCESSHCRMHATLQQDKPSLLQTGSRMRETERVKIQCYHIAILILFRVRDIELNRGGDGRKGREAKVLRYV